VDLSDRTIDLLTLDFPPISGGISRYLYEIATHLPPGMVRVTGVAADSNEAADASYPLAVHRLPVPTHADAFARQLKFFAPFYLGHLLRQRDLSFLLCGQAHYSVLLPAWTVSRLRRVPFGVFTYGLDLLYPQTTAYREVFNRSLTAADVVFADSSAAERILWDLGVDPERIQVVFPSVNLAREAVREELVAALRGRHDLEGKSCILTLGRLIERKGHDVVLQAMPAILQAVPDAHYLIVGRGPNEAALRQLIETLGLSDHVTMVGFVTDDEAAAYFALCDVFTMISRSIPETGDIEGFGIVYLEANLLKKPVVAGDSGGVPDAVVHGETGLLVDPTDSQAVAGALITLLQDRSLAQQLGQQGYDRVVTQFSSDAAAEKVYARLQAVWGA
jgi:phosphatidylinositol alpha-1,6-mannosyltransferase